MCALKDEIKKRGPFESLEQEAYLNLLRTSDALAREFDEVFKPAGLSEPQYNVLRILRGAGGEGLPCGEVAQRMIARDPDMTRLLDRLESRDLIARSRDSADRRVVTARITAAGLELLHQLDQPLAELHRRQLAHLSQQELRTLVQLLEKARAKEQKS